MAGAAAGVDEIGKQGQPARAEVGVGGRQRRRIERREVIGDGKPARGRHLQKAVAEVAFRRESTRIERFVERAVAGDEIDVPALSAATAPAIQNAPREPFGVTLSTPVCAAWSASKPMIQPVYGSCRSATSTRCRGRRSAAAARRALIAHRIERRPFRVARRCPDTDADTRVGPPKSSAPVATSSACKRWKYVPEAFFDIATK